MSKTEVMTCKKQVLPGGVQTSKQVMANSGTNLRYKHSRLIL